MERALPHQNLRTSALQEVTHTLGRKLYNKLGGEVSLSKNDLQTKTLITKAMEGRVKATLITDTRCVDNPVAVLILLSRWSLPWALDRPPRPSSPR